LTKSTHRSKFTLTLFWCIINITLAYSQSNLPNIEELTNKTHGERALILTSFYENTLADFDSIPIFSKIKEIEAIAKKYNDRDLELEAAVMRVHYYYYREKFPKSFVVNKLLKLNRIAIDENVLWLEARMQNMLGNYLYYHQQDYAGGFEYYEKVGVLLEKMNSEEFPLKEICLYQIGSVYYEFKEYEEAVHYLRRASEVDSKNTRYYYKPNINNTLGVAYSKLKKIDSSDYFLNKAMSYANAENDSVWIGILSGNLGYNNYLRKDYSNAKKLLNIDLRQALKDQEKGWGLASDASMNLAQIAFEQSDIDKADSLGMLSKSYAYQSQELYRLESLYTLLAKIKAATGEAQLAAIYIDSAAIIKERVDKQYDARILTRAKQRVQLEQIRAKEIKTELKTKNRILYRNLIILALAVVVGVILLFYNRYKLRSKNREQQINAQKEVTMLKLQMATGRLEEFKKSIKNKNQVLERIKTKLELSELEVKTLKTESSKDIQNQDAVLEQLQEAAILTDKDWRDFVSLFEMVHDGFFVRLKDLYPELTPSEVRLFALSKLNLGNKEMALMLGVGHAAIRQIKSRLRKKIALSKEVSFSEIVAEL
jgi:DNA-binding CsgD family transcriptional regulator